MYNGDTLLHVAAARGSDNLTIKYLLSRGIDVNARNDLDQTPLHSAALHNKGQSNISSAKILLENGADIFAKDKDGNMPLHYLLIKKNPNPTSEIVELFLKHLSIAHTKNQQIGNSKKKKTDHHQYANGLSKIKNKESDDDDEIFNIFRRIKYIKKVIR